MDLIPLDIHPLFFSHMDLQTALQGFCVCKFWRSFATPGFYRSICLRRGYSESLKPEDRDWKWVIQSKQLVVKGEGGGGEEGGERGEGGGEEGGGGPEGGEEFAFSGIGSKTLTAGVYEGEWVNGKREGVGVFYWSTVEKYDVVYIGLWKDDVRGRGTCYWSTGDKYSGDWVDDKASGEGTFYWASGSVYSGEWKKGKQQGKGRFEWKQGDYYDGHWVDGKQSGFGVFKWASGNEYCGEWLDDMKCGFGKFCWTTGDTYEGHWVNNRKEGHGVILWKNGDKYDGEWFADKKSGQGKFTWSTGDWYSGGWDNNKKHGKGLYSWTNGDEFEGEWTKGIQSGHGKNTWSNRNSFDGEWVNGDKRSGTFYEAPSRRYFEATLSDTPDITFMHPDLQRAVANKKCTFSVTGQLCYFQYLWETRENVDRTHGVCYACHEHCVPKNGIKLLEPNKFHFGGNFYCDCGFGYLDKPCSLVSPCSSTREVQAEEHEQL